MPLLTVADRQHGNQDSHSAVLRLCVSRLCAERVRRAGNTPWVLRFAGNRLRSVEGSGT